VNARCYGRQPLIAFLALACAVLVPAAAASADGTGGGGLAGGTSPVGTTTIPTGSGNEPVSTSGDGLTLSTTSSSLLNRTLTLTGTATSAAGQEVQIEREGKQTGWLWMPVATVPVAADGSFSATWATNQAGRYAVRAQVVDNLASAADATPSLTVTVYRQAKATLYGPGFYGNKTACGARLTTTTIGVANRTLPCGSTVSLLFNGRTLAVPVIDRGPYANGADWDLTEATAHAIGMDGTEQIGAVVLPKVPVAARRAAMAPPAPVLIGAQGG
jgi:rare lipoprotein A